LRRRASRGGADRERHPEGPPVSTSTVTALPVCCSCHTPIEGEPVRRLRLGKPVDLHPRCWERIEAALKYQRERAERDLERQERHIARRFEACASEELCCFPDWPWARFDN